MQIKHLLPVGLFAGMFLLPFTLAAKDKIVQTDDFANVRQRSWSFKTPAANGNWQQDMEISKPAGRLFIRFFKSGSLKKIELFKVNSKKALWTTSNVSKSQFVKSTPQGKYLLRFSGGSGKECHVDIASRNQYGRMISWNTESAKIEPQSSGIKLIPTGKNARFYGRCFQLQKDKLYSLELEVESLAPQKISLVVSKHKVARRQVNFPLEAGKKTTVRAQYRLPADNGNIVLYFNAPLLVKKLTITGNGKEISPAAPASAPAASPGKPANDGRFLEQRNEEKEPVNPALKTPVFYRRAPRLVYPDSIPQEYEICNELNSFGPPGDHALIYAVLHNPGKARPVSIATASDLTCGTNRITADQLNISEIAFSNYPRGKLSSQIIPELILDQSGKELNAGGNRMYRFFLKLKPETAPGRYQGKVTLQCGETGFELPLTVTVLPFRLMTPAQDEFVWSMYSRIQGRPQRNYRGAIRDRYFQDMRDAGITSLHYSMRYNEQSVKRLQERRKKQGFTAPPVFYGIRAHQEALKNLGLPADDKLWYDNENVRKEYVRLMKIFDSWMKKYGGEGYNDYYVSCVDEPFLGKMKRAEWENRLVRQAGLKTAATIYQPRYVEMLAPDLDLSINMFINRDPEVLKQLKDIQKKYPKLHYWYLGAGAYDNQEGGLMPNRLLAGFGSFRSGVKGHISFTYQNIGTTIDAFRSPILRGYGMTFPVAKPTKDKVTIFTLEWDGLREGIIDYRYLYTLQKLIHRKAGTPAAQRGQQTLDYILKHTAWLDQMTHAQGITARRDMTNDNVDKLRALAANAITELVKEK